MTTSTMSPTRRERVRAATMDEIKAAALDLLRSGSASDLKFSDIARELGMTAPALYRYYKDRNDLLAALILDAYADLAASLHTAIAGVSNPRAALTALCHGYRGWAVADPVRFGLVFGMPIPGFEMPESAGTVECANEAMMALESIPLLGARSQAGLHPLIATVGSSLKATLYECRTVPDGELAPDARQAIFLVWTTLHGFTCLEVFHHLEFIPTQAREEFFQAQVDLCASILGI